MPTPLYKIEHSYSQLVCSDCARDVDTKFLVILILLINKSQHSEEIPIELIQQAVTINPTKNGTNWRLDDESV